jgi:hypothetical protein
MKKTNIFTEKIISDLDSGDVKNSQWVFPTIGFRFFNKDGKGLIASQVPSNDPVYDLPQDFVIVGAWEHDGVAYLFLHNELTGQGQVGTFPSPMLTQPGYTNTYRPLQNFFDAAGVLGDFTTTRFNFDTHHQVWPLGKESFDESVDVYFVDNKNPDRVINNGFKRDGTDNGRRIKDGYFDGVLNLAPTTTKELLINSASVGSGGRLQPGNYFIYARYLVEDYSATPFVKEVGPISISQGDILSLHEGLQEEDWGTSVKNTIDKFIKIDFQGLDASFAFLQVAVVRYSATTENGPAQPDTYLVNKYYPINGTDLVVIIDGTEPKATLTYDEILAAALEYNICKTHTQVHDRHLRGNLKKSISNLYRDDLIAFAKDIIIGEKNETADWLLNIPQNELTTDGPVNAYSDYLNVKDRVGYFKGEIYPFGIVAKYTDGTVSEWFPCTGNLSKYITSGFLEKGLYRFNQWADMPLVNGKPSQAILSAVTFNTSAAYANYKAHPMWKSIVGFYFVRGDRMDNFLYQGLITQGYHSAAVEFLNSDTVQNFVTRAGSFMQPYHDDPNGESQTSVWQPEDAAIMPLVRGYLPMATEVNHDGMAGFYGYLANLGIVTFSPYYGGSTDGNCYNCYELWAFPQRVFRHFNTIGATFVDRDGYYQSTKIEDNKHGVFSPDLLFDPNPEIPSSVSVSPIFKFFNNKASGDSNAMRHNLDVLFAKYPYTGSGKVNGNIVLDLAPGQNPDIDVLSNMAKDTYHPALGTFVDNNSGKGEMNFCYYMESEKGFAMQNSGAFNRNYGSSRYIGLLDSNSEMKYLYGGEDFEAMSIVNVLKNALTTQTLRDWNDNFNIGTTTASIISGLFRIEEIGDLQNGTAGPIYLGDCFLQKTWFRSHRWLNIDHPVHVTNPIGQSGNGFGIDAKDSGGCWFQHAMFIGIITESRFNAGMRNDVVGLDSEDKKITYTFFPRCKSFSGNIWDFIIIEPGNFQNEATQINAGYNKILSDRKYIGFEVTEPKHELIKPNRVDASDKHIAGAFIDGYRSIQAGTFQDYALEDGYIIFIGRNENYPFIVQENGINQIYVELQATQQLDTGSDAILGSSLTYFSDKSRKVAGFGSQHQSSIIYGYTGVFGVDSLKRIFWMLRTEQTTGGSFYLKASDLSSEMFISGEIDKIFNLFSTLSNKTAFLTDDPLNGSGIVGFADPDNKEVGMTFLLPTPQGFIWRTLIFNEKMGFAGYYPFFAALYFNTQKDLFGANHYLDDSYNFKQGSRVFKFNSPLSYGNFFGEQTEACLSFIVNGIGDKPEDNMRQAMKIFNSIGIESKRELFEKIVFETQYQSSIFDFGTGKFWLKPEYKEHKWCVPIKVQTSNSQDAFRSGSEMAGMWMKITLYFKGSKDPEIKSVDTNFDIAVI